MNINARVFVTSANVRTYTHASGGTYAYVRTHVCICTYVLIRTSVRADAYVRTYTCRLRFGSYVVWGDWRRARMDAVHSSGTLKDLQLLVLSAHTQTTIRIRTYVRTCIRSYVRIHLRSVSWSTRNFYIRKLYLRTYVRTYMMTPLVGTWLFVNSAIANNWWSNHNWYPTPAVCRSNSEDIDSMGTGVAFQIRTHRKHPQWGGHEAEGGASVFPFLSF